MSIRLILSVDIVVFTLNGSQLISPYLVAWQTAVRRGGPELAVLTGEAASGTLSQTLTS